MSSTRSRWTAALILIALPAAVAFAVGSPTPWTGVGFLAMWCLFFLAGSAWVPRDDAADAPDEWVAALRFLVVSTAAGFATAIVLWSLSALITKHLIAGSGILIALAAIGAVRLVRTRASLATLAGPVPLCLTAFAFVLGFYIYGVNEIRVGNELLFTYRFDVAHHMHWAGLIKGMGLPLVEHNGVEGILYMPLYHTGILVAAAGVEELSASTLYQAARILGVGCLMLIVGAGALLASRFRMRGWQLVLCSITPLAWAFLSLPLDALRENWQGVLDPYVLSVPLFSASSGSLFHNLPQAGTVAICAAALVVLDRYREKGRLAQLALCGLLLGVSTMVKPTVAIVFVPATLIVLAVGRVPLRHLLVLAAAMAVGVVIYMLPTFVADLDASPGWEVELRNLLKRRRLVEIAVLGIVIPIAVMRATQLVRLKDWRGWQVLDVQLVALFGGILFAAVFVEPTRVGKGNEVWSRNAAMILLAPCVTAIVLGFANEARRAFAGFSWRALSAAAATAVLAVHIATGAIYTVRYPTLSVQHVPIDNASTLRAVAAATPRSARLLADIRSVEVPLVPRRMVFAGSFTQEILSDLEKWRRIREETWNDTMWATIGSRDGIVLGNNTRRLKPVLTAMGWRPVLAGGRYEFWAPQGHTTARR